MKPNPTSKRHLLSKLVDASNYSRAEEKVTLGNTCHRNWANELRYSTCRIPSSQLQSPISFPSRSPLTSPITSTAQLKYSNCQSKPTYLKSMPLANKFYCYCDLLSKHSSWLGEFSFSVALNCDTPLSLTLPILKGPLGVFLVQPPNYVASNFLESIAHFCCQFFSCRVTWLSAILKSTHTASQLITPLVIIEIRIINLHHCMFPSRFTIAIRTR